MYLKLSTGRIFCQDMTVAGSNRQLAISVNAQGKTRYSLTTCGDVFPDRFGDNNRPVCTQ